MERMSCVRGVTEPWISYRSAQLIPWLNFELIIETSTELDCTDTAARRTQSEGRGQGVWRRREYFA